MDDVATLAQANDMIRQQQQNHQRSAGTDNSPLPIGRTIAQRLADLEAKSIDDTEARRREAEQKTRQEACEQQRRQQAWAALAQKFGARYRDCTLDSYRAVEPDQQTALDGARDYVMDLANNLRNGRGALLFGPPGTGKDHLAVAIAREAVLSVGASVDWTDGAEFYGAVRDNIDGDKSEAAFLKRFTSPVLLVMSDPMPPVGSVNGSFQLQMLFRMIDRRYRDLKATVVTLNVASRKEVEDRLAPNIIDRLAQDSLTIHCNWRSFRRG